MLVRPGELAGRGSALRKLSETFTLPVGAARNKAREIISQSSSSTHVSVVERWHQLADGKIEFTVRWLPAAMDETQY
jgi:hypothetical protein